MTTLEEKDTKPEEQKRWTQEVEEELMNVLSKFLPLSKSGGWGIKYINPIIETYENGTAKRDENKCIGAVMYIQFDFENTYTIEETER